MQFPSKWPLFCTRGYFWPRNQGLDHLHWPSDPKNTEEKTLVSNVQHYIFTYRLHLVQLTTNKMITSLTDQIYSIVLLCHMRESYVTVGQCGTNLTKKQFHRYRYIRSLGQYKCKCKYQYICEYKYNYGMCGCIRPRLRPTTRQEGPPSPTQWSAMGPWEVQIRRSLFSLDISQTILQRKNVQCSNWIVVYDIWALSLTYSGDFFNKWVFGRGWYIGKTT